MELYKNAKIYYIWEEHFEDKYIEDAKCCKNRDHCHYTGEYRGATHSICHLTDYTLLTLQELWQAQYQILSITFLKEFIKLSV